MLTCAAPFAATIPSVSLWEPWGCRTTQMQRMKGSVPARSNLSAPVVREAPLLESASESASAAHDAAPDFDRVYVEHFQHVSRWARAFGGLEADLDDLTQDVFMVVRRKLSSYVGPSMQAWLYGITRKTVSDYRRRAFF